jgi:diguanylate cyclase
MERFGICRSSLNDSVGSCIDFESAAKQTLKYLHERIGFELWMVTRTNGDDWIVLHSEDHGYNVHPGAVFKWADSFCSEMVKGNGPRIAPASSLVPAYASAPIGQAVKIEAYIGHPLTGINGEFFGTLCAVDPKVQPESLVGEEALINLLGNLLSGILQNELASLEEKRLRERIELDSLTDHVTKLYNRRAWMNAIASEEERCRRYGSTAVVIVLDLDGLKGINDSQGHNAGDQYIRLAAEVIAKTVRKSDIPARLGGDEFGILAIECDGDNIQHLIDRLQRGFASAGVETSIGFCARNPASGLSVAWENADLAMYESKRKRKVA